MSELDQIKTKFEDRFRKRLDDALKELFFSVYDVEHAGGGPDDVRELIQKANTIMDEKLISSLKLEG